MSQFQQWTLFSVRVSMGWFMLAAGVSKFLNPQWSAAGYLASAKTFAGFYQWLATPPVLPAINFINEWALTLLGVSLLLGIMVRFSTVLGAALMILYYFPVLDFPTVGRHGFVVDEHIIYAAALLALGAFRAGRFWGLEQWCSSLPLCSRFPRLRFFLG